MTIAQQLEQKGIDRTTVMKMTGLTEDNLAQLHH